MEKILICSIIEGQREALKLILGDHFDLILCQDQTACLDILKNGKVRLLLFDLDKQEKVSKLIKEATRAKPKLKIVVLANHKSEKDALKAVKDGAHGYIIKPIKSEELLSVCK